MINVNFFYYKFNNYNVHIKLIEKGRNHEVTGSTKDSRGIAKKVPIIIPN